MFDNLKINTKVFAGLTIIPILSLINGIAFGRNIKSPFAISLFAIILLLTIFVIIGIDRNIKTSIGSIIQDLNETSSNLKLLTDDLTSTGHQLAEGSTEQAASIQETSSTLEEASSMIHQTTQNTKEADALAKQTKQSADAGNVEMNQMLSSMEELKKSSDEIAKIIKVIDEIAFQTNILSLNAAVEAARAGEAGKGFAVVAEEVRNLAQRSATAAKDTTTIIESNISLSEKCLKITKQVGESLAGIKEDTHKVSELLDEISTASQEQEIGINQINQAVSQMETVLQENASTAQESVASADNLTVYSSSLQSSIGEISNLIDYTKPEKGYNSQRPEKRIDFKLRKTSSRNESSKSNFTNKKTQVKPIESKTVVKVEAPKPKAEIKKISNDPKKINPEDIIPLEDF